MTVPTLCPELPYVAAGDVDTPVVPLVPAGARPVAVCALAEKENAANPAASSAVAKSFVLVMACPFEPVSR